MRNLTALLLVPLLMQTSFAQEVWTLQKCIDHALENNLQVEQSDLSVKTNESWLKQSKLSRYPTVNGSASHSYNFGRSVDPTTNDFVNNTIQSNFFGINANLVLFDGFQRNNTIKKTQTNLDAAKYNAEQTRNDITLAILTSYLQILFDRENVENSQNQLEVTSKLIERTSALVEAGVLVEGELFNLEAQLANEQVQLVDAKNRLELSYLDLKQLLNIEASRQIEIQEPVLSVNESGDSIDYGSFYQNVLDQHPGIKSSEVQLMSSQYDVEIAKSGLQPTLSVGASINTRYSSIGQEVVGSTSFTTPIGYLASDASELVLADGSAPVLQETPFGDQLNTNLSQSVGFNLSIPIFNGLQSRESVQRSKIQYLTNKSQNEQAKNQLRKEVEQALTNVRAAEQKYAAALKSKEANDKAFFYAQERYNQKLITSIDFVDAKNKLTTAESNVLQSKYDYIFKSKIIDFYLGKALTFE